MRSSIAIKEIPKEAYIYSSYNGFLYEISLIKDVESPTRPGVILPKGKSYIGAHGSDNPNKNCNVDDGYLESCRDEEFRLLICGTEPVFKLRVWYLVKNWNEAKNEEHRVLKEFGENGEGAAKSEMSWNQHNGFPTHRLIDRKACKAMVDEIIKRENCKWGVNYVSPSKYKGKTLERIQVRKKDDAAHKKDIKHRINDNNGVVKLNENPDIDPCVIFEKRADDGRNTLVDGNMTSGAIKQKDCMAQEIPEICVPLKDHEHLTNSEVRHIALSLNRRGKKIKKPTDVEDAIKFLLGITNEGEDEITEFDYDKYDTKFNREMIKEDYDLNSDQVNKTMDGVKDALFDEEQRKLNMLLPDYTHEEKQARVDELKVTFPEEIIFYASTKNLDKMRAMILAHIDKDMEEAAAAIPEREPYKKVRLVANYSQSKSSRDFWIRKDTGAKAILQRQWDNLDSAYELAFEEIALAVKDNKKDLTEE